MTVSKVQLFKDFVPELCYKLQLAATLFGVLHDLCVYRADRHRLLHLFLVPGIAVVAA